MKPTTVPLICGLALAAMSAAGISHWYSVDHFVTAIRGGLPIQPPAATPAAPQPESAPAPDAPAMLAKATEAASAATDPDQKKFYEALIAKMESLQTQNRDLLDQMAETNRDVMKLEFRVDTHSESFRPMPVSEERFDTSFDSGPGVLPPRAEPVFLPMDE